jgi:hypothetical protein
LTFLSKHEIIAEKFSENFSESSDGDFGFQVRSSKYMDSMPSSNGPY